MRVGVLSDTHNLLRPRVLERLAGCERILHGGDVGDLAILEQLRALAPVEAVRGNTDSGATADALPEVLSGDLGGLPFRMVHRREDVDPAWLREARLVDLRSHRTGRSSNGAVTGATACCSTRAPAVPGASICP